MSESARAELIATLARDLVGPHGDDLLSARPSDQFLLGTLYPRETETQPAVEEDSSDVATDESDGDAGLAIPMSGMRRPTSMGISFSLVGKEPRVVISGS